MSGNMRAILVKDGKGGIESLYHGEVPKPVAGPGYVVVKVCICKFGKNYVDIKYHR